MNVLYINLNGMYIWTHIQRYILIHILHQLVWITRR